MEGGLRVVQDPNAGKNTPLKSSVKKGVSGPACRSGAGEPLAGMPGEKSQWPEVSQESELGASRFKTGFVSDTAP